VRGFSRTIVESSTPIFMLPARNQLFHPFTVDRFRGRCFRVGGTIATIFGVVCSRMVFVSRNEKNKKHTLWVPHGGQQ
jgi:hypothetical protein